MGLHGWFRCRLCTCRIRQLYHHRLLSRRSQRYGWHLLRRRILAVILGANPYYQHIPPTGSHRRHTKRKRPWPLGSRGSCTPCLFLYGVTEMVWSCAYWERAIRVRLWLFNSITSYFRRLCPIHCRWLRNSFAIQQPPLATDNTQREDQNDQRYRNGYPFRSISIRSQHLQQWRQRSLGMGLHNQQRLSGTAESQWIWIVY